MNTLKRLFVYLLIVLFISIFFQSAAILFLKNSKDGQKLAVEKSFQNGHIGSAEKQPSRTGGDHLLSTISNMVDSLYKDQPGDNRDKMVVSVNRASSIEEYKPVVVSSQPANATTIAASQNATQAAAEVGTGIPYGKNIVFHSLVAGERLSDLAGKYSMKLEDIKKMNGFGESYRLYVGQKIMVIPNYDASQQVPARTASQQQPAVRVVTAPPVPAAPESSRDLAVEASKKLDDDINNILKSARSSKLLKRNASFTDEAQVSPDAHGGASVAGATDGREATETRRVTAPGREQAEPVSKDPLSDIIKSAKKKRRVFKWPVRGEVSSKFGMRVHPVRGEVAMHTGIDIAQRPGRAIIPAMGGKVTFAGWMGGYGKMVEIRHPKGYTTRYAHMSKIKVRAGQDVGSQTVIGQVGDTGTSTGYHLHFEIRKNGKPLNPVAFLQN